VIYALPAVEEPTLNGEQLPVEASHVHHADYGRAPGRERATGRQVAIVWLVTLALAAALYYTACRL